MKVSLSKEMFKWHIYKMEYYAVWGQERELGEMEGEAHLPFYIYGYSEYIYNFNFLKSAFWVTGLWAIRLTEAVQSTGLCSE